MRAVRLGKNETNGLRSLPYSEYLQTPHWKRVRAEALRRAGRRCSKCGLSGDLDVHHVSRESYERRGSERANDLAVLCRRHHHELHPGWLDDRPDLAQRWRNRLKSEERYPSPYHRSTESMEIEVPVDEPDFEPAEWWDQQTDEWKDNIH